MSAKRTTTTRDVRRILLAATAALALGALATLDAGNPPPAPDPEPPADTEPDPEPEPDPCYDKVGNKVPCPDGEKTPGEETEPEEDPTPIPDPEPEPEPTPEEDPTPTPEPEPSPSPEPEPTPEDDPTPTPQPSPTPSLCYDEAGNVIECETTYPVPGATPTPGPGPSPTPTPTGPTELPPHGDPTPTPELTPPGPDGAPDAGDSEAETECCGLVRQNGTLVASIEKDGQEYGKPNSIALSQRLDNCERWKKDQNTNGRMFRRFSISGAGDLDVCSRNPSMSHANDTKYDFISTLGETAQLDNTLTALIARPDECATYSIMGKATDIKPTDSDCFVQDSSVITEQRLLTTWAPMRMFKLEADAIITCDYVRLAPFVNRFFDGGKKAETKVAVRIQAADIELGEPLKASVVRCNPAGPNDPTTNVYYTDEVVYRSSSVRYEDIPDSEIDWLTRSECASSLGDGIPLCYRKIGSNPWNQYARCAQQLDCDDSYNIIFGRNGENQIVVTMNGKADNSCQIGSPDVDYKFKVWLKARGCPDEGSADCGLTYSYKYSGSTKKYPKVDMRIDGHSIGGFPFDPCVEGTTPLNLSLPEWHSTQLIEFEDF
ncbi:MAG: hypothetical protein RLY93_13240 [Sumerlaeia bacterium]